MTKQARQRMLWLVLLALIVLQASLVLVEWEGVWVALTYKRVDEVYYYRYAHGPEQIYVRDHLESRLREGARQRGPEDDVRWLFEDGKVHIEIDVREGRVLTWFGPNLAPIGQCSRGGFAKSPPWPWPLPRRTKEDLRETLDQATALVEAAAARGEIVLPEWWGRTE
ncbi:MAG: hypothetical protein AAF581_21905 [Planctomycetota bacterium]